MKEQGSSPDSGKVERAASTLSNRQKRHLAGDLSNLFEVSIASKAPKAPTEQKPPPSLVRAASTPRYSVFDRVCRSAIKCVCMHVCVCMPYSCMHVDLLRAGNFRSQSEAGGTGVSKWKTVLNPLRAIQGMRRPSTAQPIPPQTEAAVAKPEQDVTPGKGFKWRTAFQAVRAVDDMKSHAGGGGAGDSGDSLLIGGGMSSPLDSRYSVTCFTSAKV
jgi:hypothetical protein